MNYSHIPPQVLDASVSSQFFKELYSKFTGQAEEMGALQRLLAFDSGRLRKQPSAHRGLSTNSNSALPQTHTFRFYLSVCYQDNSWPGQSSVINISLQMWAECSLSVSSNYRPNNIWKEVIMSKVFCCCGSATIHIDTSLKMFHCIIHVIYHINNFPGSCSNYKNLELVSTPDYSN